MATSATPTDSRTRAPRAAHAHGRSWSGPRAEAAAIDTDGPADRGPDHPRHAQGHRRAPDRGGRPGTSTSCGSSTRWAVRSSSCPQLTQFQPADTPERLEAFIARLHAYPAFMAANAEILRDGHRLRADRAAHRGRTDDRPDRADARRSRSSRRSCPSMVKVASDADRERVRDVVRDVVYPADQAFLEALRGDYLAATREDPGLWSAPNGEQLYRTAIRSWTTLDLDPEEVHRIGLEELESIEAERRVISDAAGFGDDTAAYRASLDADPANTPQTKDELVARATEDIERGDGRRAALLRRPADAPAARCARSRSTRRRTRRSPTTTRRPRTARGRASTTPTATTCRAASTRSSPRRPTTRRRPGHHFQITLEMENPHLITFRRLGARMVGGAYVEGWGLYSERLADEMGLFRDEARAVRDARRAGVARRPARRRHRPPRPALAAPALDRLPQDGRAVRDRRRDRDRPLHLLAGPGADLQDRPARDRAAAAPSWPRATGRRFDLRAFHDAVLGHGSLPLATLSRELPNWLGDPGLTGARSPDP